jgi:hypothetical protein
MLKTWMWHHPNHHRQSELLFDRIFICPPQTVMIKTQKASIIPSIITFSNGVVRVLLLLLLPHLHSVAAIVL